MQAMKRELNSKLSPRSAGGEGNNHNNKPTRSSIAESYRMNTSTGSKMRALRPLGAQKAEPAQEEELPAGNCAIM